jgi:hypothetical protein
MNVHEIIDKFVESINSPESKFQQTEKADWINNFEMKLSKRLPVSFQSLISRYAFDAFEYNGLSFFANYDLNENLSIAIFKDRFISEAALQNGFIQFARPEGSSYDPICFDTNISRSGREFPMVQLDHEAILCRDKIRITQTVSNSFLEFASMKFKNF